jgi:hypothetical protein
MLYKLRKKISSMPVMSRWRRHRHDRALLHALDPAHTRLRWEIGPRAPQHTVEANRALIGSHLYITGGYAGSLGVLSKRLYRLDMGTDRWADLGRIPDRMPETHNAVLSDGHRFLFSISGQLGPHCCPAVPDCFFYDTRTARWGSLPPLPEPRYMPMADYHHGRIHVLGGTLPDRCSPAFEWWSLGFQNGDADPNGWKFERRLVESRTHTPCLFIGDRLHIFGGQIGDVPAIPGSPDCRCNFDSFDDVLFDNVVAYDPVTGEQTERSPMPFKISHTEYTVLQIGHHVLIGPGTLARTITHDAIMALDLRTDSWRVIGHTPYPMKKTVMAWHNGWLYIATGQRAVGPDDLRPGEVVDSVWKAPLNPDTL